MNHLLSCRNLHGPRGTKLRTTQPASPEDSVSMNAWRRLWRLYAAAILVAVWVSPSSGQDENKVQLASKSVTPQRSTAADTKVVDEGFVIGPEDLLAINVWKEPDISRSIPVRSDGKITLPLIGEIQASGKTPHTLEQEIAAKLQGYMSEPEVTVIVQEIRSQRFNILGQVSKPGPINCRPPARFWTPLLWREASATLPRRNQSTCCARPPTADKNACRLTTTKSLKVRSRSRT